MWPRRYAEQQPVRGLVHQRRELRVRAAHEHEGRDPDEPVVGPHGDADDCDRLHVQEDHGERIAQVRGPAQLLAELGGRAAGFGDAIGRVHRVEKARLRDHRRGHARHITL
jgi:hypothetical protein